MVRRWDQGGSCGFVGSSLKLIPLPNTMSSDCVVCLVSC